MENNYQELILNHYEVNSSVLKDCFAISRIQIEIGALSRTAPFNQSSQIKLKTKHHELEIILDRYPLAIKKLTDGE